jgi:hypothetical protein
MLTMLTRKLCPLMTLAIATLGCGKKITEDSSKVTKPDRQNIQLPSSYMIQLDGSKDSRLSYELPAAANFEIPDRIKVKQGKPIGKTVEIAHNLNPYDSNQYDFKCTYKSIGSDLEMVLQKCATMNEDFSDIEYQLPQILDEKDIIQIRFTGPSASDLIVEAFYSMDWIIEQ